MIALEEMSMNAFPSLQTGLYDGWILRFADGYSNRANSVNPIYPCFEDIHQKIDRCEAVFKSRDLKPTYKITPFVHPANLDELLADRGYTIIHPTSVQTLNLERLPEQSYTSLGISNDPTEEWIEAYCEFNHISDVNRGIYQKMLGNLIPTRFFASITRDHQIIACGMAVLEGDFIGLFDLVVEEKHRNCGYGKQLILNMLAIGKTYGAKNAYLQVMLDNAPAFHLYKRLGFEESYPYHYRVLME